MLKIQSSTETKIVKIGLIDASKWQSFAFKVLDKLVKRSDTELTSDLKKQFLHISYYYFHIHLLTLVSTWWARPVYSVVSNLRNRKFMLYLNLINMF